ncbi:MAG: glycosyltransferase N-terminal domain-containing protein [Bacteroidota bacterium]
MYFLYDLIVHITWFHLKIIAFFNPKLKLFVKGRKKTFDKINDYISTGDKVLWIHAASLGEFEQGLPVIEKLRAHYIEHKIVITFFSPSGYEVKKNTAIADLVLYLPMDTQANARKFIAQLKPELALFIKYEIWPNYLRTLKQQQIPTLVISAIFKREQIYFKRYGNFMRKALAHVTHIFVQDKHSKELLKTIGRTNVSVSGDTRFDRVSEILQRDNSLDFMKSFKGEHPCFVAGSTWPEDETIITPYINSTEIPMKYVLAPHNIKADHVKKLVASFTKKVILYSSIHKGENLSDYDILIVDTIGLLTKIYSYADLAYVGGGFSTGLHNTLEPAVFGIPIVIGTNYIGFKEAEDLVHKKGIVPIDNGSEFKNLMDRLMGSEEFTKKTGKINASYVLQNKGASVQIMDHIRTLL